MPESEARPACSSLGIIAGNGAFPQMLAMRARDLGMKVVVAAHRGETATEIEGLADVVTWIRVGQFGKVIRSFKRQGVTDVVFAGGIRRVNLFGGVRPDWCAVKIIARAGSIRDDVILRATAEALEREGFRVRAGTDFLTECLAREGTLGARSLTPEEWDDAQLAWEAAKAIGRLDIGQAAAAFGGLVVAVEAIEGTDGMIERAGSLIASRPARRNSAGAVLVKTFKPQQDVRLDLPTVGSTTLQNLHAAGFTALVLEADRAMILAPDEFIAMANSLNIAVAVHSEESIVSTGVPGVR